MTMLEYKLRRQFGGVDGVWGSDEEVLPAGATIHTARATAERMLEHGTKVTIFSRPRLDWNRVESVERNPR